MAEVIAYAPPDLTRDEVDEICAPLTQNAAKVRYLQGLGVTVARRPDGSPLVNRAHYDEVRRGKGSPSSQVIHDGPIWGVH